MSLSKWDLYKYVKLELKAEGIELNHEESFEYVVEVGELLQYSGYGEDIYWELDLNMPEEVYEN